MVPKVFESLKFYCINSIYLFFICHKLPFHMMMPIKIFFLYALQSEKNRPEKIRTMLDYLQRRGPKAFELFLVCLRESDHGFVASYLLQV